MADTLRYDFLRAIGGTTDAPEILAKVRGREELITYTMEIFDLLKSDPDIIAIMDAETGELLYER